MDKSQKDSAELQRIKAQLIRGDVKTITEKAEKSRSHVVNVLAGKSEDLAVIECAIDILEERHQKSKKIQERIEKLKS